MERFQHLEIIYRCTDKATDRLIKLLLATKTDHCIEFNKYKINAELMKSIIERFVT